MNIRSVEPSFFARGITWMFGNPSLYPTNHPLVKSTHLNLSNAIEELGETLMSNASLDNSSYWHSYGKPFRAVARTTVGLGIIIFSVSLGSGYHLFRILKYSVLYLKNKELPKSFDHWQKVEQVFNTLKGEFGFLRDFSLHITFISLTSSAFRWPTCVFLGGGLVIGLAALNFIFPDKYLPELRNISAPLYHSVRFYQEYGLCNPTGGLHPFDARDYAGPGGTLYLKWEAVGKEYTKCVDEILNKEPRLINVRMREAYALPNALASFLAQKDCLSDYVPVLFEYARKLQGKREKMISFFEEDIEIKHKIKENKSILDYPFNTHNHPLSLDETEEEYNNRLSQLLKDSLIQN